MTSVDLVVMDRDRSEPDKAIIIISITTHIDTVERISCCSTLATSMHPEAVKCAERSTITGELDAHTEIGHVC